MSVLQTVGIGFLVGMMAARALGAPQEVAGSQQPAAGFTVIPDEDGQVELAAVLAEFERVSGWRLTMDEETARLVSKNRFFASGPIECGAEDVTAVVGAILSGQRFLWSVVRADSPTVMSLRSLDTTARGTARQDARYVPPEQLGDFAGSAGLLIETMLTLPSTDVRTLSNSMRSLTVDPNTLQIIPAGNTNTLSLQGFAPMIHDLTWMLRAVDAEASGEAGTPRRVPPVLHAASGEFTIPASGEDGVDMLELVRLHARATGQVAIVDAETRRLLQTSRPGLSAPITLSGDDFATFCEELLLERKFVITDLTHGSPCLYAVRSLTTPAFGFARQDARYVDAESLALCARRPATLFVTTVTLSHVDVRTLSNSLRSMIVDPNTLQIVPVGNTTSLLLQGFGRRLVDLVEMLRRLDAEAGAQAPKAEEAEGDGGEDD